MIEKRLKIYINLLIKNRQKCCYVNDPTLTWDENDNKMQNEFLTAFTMPTNENTTEFIHVQPISNAIKNGANQNDGIYQEENDTKLNNE